jgi:hypothetical protein
MDQAFLLFFSCRIAFMSGYGVREIEILKPIRQKLGDNVKEMNNQERRKIEIEGK